MSENPAVVAGHDRCSTRPPALDIGDIGDIDRRMTVTGSGYATDAHRPPPTRSRHEREHDMANEPDDTTPDPDGPQHDDASGEHAETPETRASDDDRGMNAAAPTTDAES